ncbi:hypothetical protein Glove_413g16 [Diversispora epigaea]|uniref:Uncharacterized protein n=1 Tax=Diversispora epigaea TaxID=1348612 RepID=A0A397H1S9_9GLOM|nr:hypothetical protein Glove_413g16 [Diversispora epigaea]
MVNTNNSGASASGRATSFQLKAHKSDQSETFTHLYEVLLYKKKDVIAIQEKLGISWEASMANGNVPKQTEHEPEGKILADSYKLLLNLVGDLILIQENLDIDGNPVLAECYNNVANQSNKDFTDLSLSKLFNLLLYLEEDIMAIQEELVPKYSKRHAVEIIQRRFRSWMKIRTNSAKIIQRVVVSWLYHPNGPIAKKASNQYYGLATSQAKSLTDCGC